MTEQEKNLLVDFELKVKQIIAKHEALKREKSHLLERIEKLEETNSSLLQTIGLLEHRYNNLKLAKMLVASEDENKDAKNRIQKLVREIDKCIALLNK